MTQEALAAFFEDIDADWSNDNIRPGDFAFRFRAAADRLRAALVRTPETLDVERLAWALTNTAQTRIGAPASKPDWIDRETARIIAAEYARLAASPEPDPGAVERVAAAIAYAIARAPVPVDADTARDVADRLAPLVIESGYLPAPDPGAGLRGALWQCGVESGMDTDGDEGPGAMIAGMGDAGFAAAMVEQVRQLRLAYDECLAPSAEPPETRCPNCDSGKRSHRGFAAGDAPIPCGDPWHAAEPPETA